MSKTTESFFVAPEEIQRIFTSGAERLIALTTSTLFAGGYEEQFQVSDGMIFPDDIWSPARSVPLIFADRWEGSKHVLSSWNGHRSVNDPQALDYGNMVTCISHHASKDIVIVGLKDGIKIFRVVNRSFGLILQNSYTTNSPVTRIILEDEGNEDPWKLTFSAHLGETQQITIKRISDTEWSVSNATNQRTLVHAEGSKGTLHITEVTACDPVLSWFPKNSNVGKVETFHLDGEITQAIVPQITRLKHVCVILFETGEVLIANLTKPMDKWVRINDRRYSSLAVTSCVGNNTAQILLASENKVFEDGRLNLRDGF